MARHVGPMRPLDVVGARKTLAVAESDAELAIEECTGAWDRIAGGGWGAVPVIAVANSMGVRVFESDLHQTFSGARVERRSDGVGSIVVEERAHPVRQRGLIAYCLGVLVASQYDSRSFPRVHHVFPKIRDSQECGCPEARAVGLQYAEAFQRALLMPSSMVVEWVLQHVEGARRDGASVSVPAPWGEVARSHCTHCAADFHVPSAVASRRLALFAVNC